VARGVTEPRLSFDAVAEDYDRFRPSYPPELVDEACAGLAPGARVLEIGCGTGQLTTALAQRGLQVEAIDPGPRMVEIARRHAPDVQFHVGSFEDVELPADAFAAVFSATAFHWVDPDVGWAKAARVLRPGGTLALLSMIAELNDEVLAAWREVLPEAAAWESHDPAAVRAGARAHGGNVSELWAWLGKRDIARPEAADLFADVHVSTMPVERLQTAQETLGEARTTSAYLRLDAERKAILERRLAAVVEAAGTAYRTTTFATLVTARAAGQPR
jgi:ubiquinone/menaquinone biosynthesis C-methylase UbiE